MEEIWFRLTNQLEVIQIESSSAVQQSYHLLVSWLSHAQHLLQNACHDQNLKYVGSLLTVWYQKTLEQVQNQYHNAQFNSRELVRHVGVLYPGEISKRDVAFCTIGLILGSVIGYNVGLNWRQNSRRVQLMKAVICHHYIGVEGVSTVDDVEIPSVQRSNELLIQVKAASVNVIDTMICSGYSRIYRKLLSNQKELPVVLGRDCAGVVMDIGQGVVGFDVGDEVFFALPSWASGTMSEYLIAAEDDVVKRPKSITFEASAGLPYNGCIALDALINKSGIEEGNARGKRVLIYGGATPVGCILIQLIKLWDGHVSVMCKLEAVKVILALGADDIIPLNDCDIDKELELHDKYDVIYLTMNDTLDHRVLKKRLKPNGKFVLTTPDHLTSDSFGFLFGLIFKGFIQAQLLLQYILGRKKHWNDGSKIKTSYIEILRDLIDADQLQSVVGAAFRPNHVEQALYHVLDPNAIGSTIIKFR